MPLLPEGQRSNVVPFAPRGQAARDAPPAEPAPDQAVVGALTATVRELLFCANVGEYLHGFALYSDRHLFRFMDDTGLTVDEFRTAFEDAAPKEADDWTRLSHVDDVRRLPDGRVTALVTYLDGDHPGGPVILRPPRGAQTWAISSISQRPRSAENSNV